MQFIHDLILVCKNNFPLKCFFPRPALSGMLNTILTGKGT